MAPATLLHLVMHAVRRMKILPERAGGLAGNVANVNVTRSRFRFPYTISAIRGTQCVSISGNVGQGRQIMTDWSKTRKAMVF